MTKLLEIFIVGLTISLASCDTLDLRYEIPKVKNCRILSNSLFCIDQTTGEEYDMEFKDCIGCIVYPVESHTTLYNFGNTVMTENVKLSRCKDRDCIRKVINSSEFRHER